MIAADNLAARAARREECAALLTAGRIHGVAGTGIRLTSHDDVAQARQRQ